MKAEESAPTTAGKILVERAGDQLRITVDGQPLPFEVDVNGVTTTVSVAHSPGITITIPAEQVEIVDSLIKRIVDGDRKARARAHLESLSPNRGRR